MTGTKIESKTLKQQDLFSSIPIEPYIPPQLQSPQYQEKPKAQVIQEVPIQKSLKYGKNSILKGIALAIGILSAIQSVYFSFDWFSDKLPIPFAVVMALIIVASSTLLPEFAIMLFKRFWLAGVGIALIGLLAMSFSMMSTIAGLYNARSSAIKTESVVNADNDKNVRLLESAKSENARLTKELEILNREIDANIAKMNNPFSTKGQKDDADWAISKSKKQKVDYEAKLATANKEVSRLQEITIIVKVERQDFYSFIASLFGWNSEAVEFCFACFPAVFLDVIAPVMLGVALFL